MIPLGTACQLLSPLGKKMLSYCPLLISGYTDLEKLALGVLACSKLVQGCKSVN